MATKVKRKTKPRQRGAVLSDVVNDYVNNTIMAKRLEWIEQSRFITMDIVTIALGRMGFRASKFKDFFPTVNEVWKDYEELIREVYKEDPDMWEAKAKIDREMKLYVGEELFEPYDKRHYSDQP